MPVTVVVRSASPTGRKEEDAPSLTFDGPRVVIGRGAGSDVRLPDPSISTRHATIRAHGTEYAIVDEGTEDAQKFGGSLPLDEPYMEIGLWGMIRKRAGWLSILFLAEMLTAWAMQYFQAELEKAIVLALFIPLVMSSGGNSGSQATSLIIRALALTEIRLRDWWRVAAREIVTGIVMGAILGVIAIVRIAAWQALGLFNYGADWPRLALAIGLALVGIVTFGTLSGAMLPFLLKRVGFDPASASAPFVATLVDVTGLVIYFSVAVVVLHGTLL